MFLPDKMQIFSITNNIFVVLIIKSFWYRVNDIVVFWIIVSWNNKTILCVYKQKGRTTFILYSTNTHDTRINNIIYKLYGSWLPSIKQKGNEIKTFIYSKLIHITNTNSLGQPWKSILFLLSLCFRLL